MFNAGWDFYPLQLGAGLLSVTGVFDAGLDNISLREGASSDQTCPELQQRWSRQPRPGLSWCRLASSVGRAQRWVMQARTGLAKSVIKVGAWINLMQVCLQRRVCSTLGGATSAFGSVQAGAGWDNPSPGLHQAQSSRQACSSLVGHSPRLAQSVAPSFASWTK